MSRSVLRRATEPASSIGIRSHEHHTGPRPASAAIKRLHIRLARQHPGQPRVRRLAASDRLVDNRHRARDQESSQVALTHLPYPAKSLLVSGRVLPRNQAEPSREVAPAPEALHSVGRRRPGSASRECVLLARMVRTRGSVGCPPVRAPGRGRNAGLASGSESCGHEGASVCVRRRTAPGRRDI